MGTIFNRRDGAILRYVRRVRAGPPLSSHMPSNSRVESAFFNKVYAYYEKHERVEYRSDPDYTGWL